MKQLSIELLPYAGLCNRMRAIASAAYIVEKTSANLDIYWRNKSGCSTDFCDLFQPINVGLPINVIEYKGLKFRKACKKNLFYPTLLRLFTINKEIRGFNRNDGKDIFTLLPDSGNIYIQTCHSLCENYSFANLFKPIDCIQKEIGKVISKYSSDTIGIHIRRTDNKKSIENSSLEAFESLIKNELNNNPMSTFYLATDDLEVKNELKRKYSRAIITNDAPLCRDSKEGMQAAVVDLWCLSKTKKIYGSYYSSYSEVASCIGQIELEIL